MAEPTAEAGEDGASAVVGMPTIVEAAPTIEAGEDEVSALVDAPAAEPTAGTCDDNIRVSEDALAAEGGAAEGQAYK